MEETKYAQIIYQAGNIPRMYLTITIREGRDMTVTENLLMDLEGNKILHLFGKTNSDGHIIHKIWHELEECYENGFAVLSHNEFLDMHNRNNNHDVIVMNVYDYSGHIIYSEKIATNENSEDEIDFRATVDDKYIDRKIAEFEAKKGGDGK